MDTYKEYSPRKRTFEHVSLSFIVGGESVTGILSGTSKMWDFTTDSKIVSKIFYTGVVKSNAIFGSLADRDQAQVIYDAIEDSAEKLGYLLND